MKRLVSGKRGFTLIEVIVTITILGVITIPLFATFASSFAIMSKSKQSIDVVSIVRLTKENVVDAIKGGSSQGLKSYSDLNGDSTVDDNDKVYWNSNTDKWVEPDGTEKNQANGLKLFDISGELKNKYIFDVSYDNGYTTAFLSGPGYDNLRKFAINIKDRDKNNLIKSINIIVSLNEPDIEN